MSIKLFGFTPTRSKRVKWMLQELDVPFEDINKRELIGSDELRAAHPQAKVPAITDNGRPLFESFAICTWLADSHPDRGLIAPSGTWERALHDQWGAFVMTEVEAHLWSWARNTFVYPEDKRSEEVIAQAKMELAKSLKVLDDHFGANDYFVAGKFTAIDVFAGFVTNWAERMEMCGDCANVRAYTARLKQRPLCTLDEGA